MGIVADESNLYKDMDGFENLCFVPLFMGCERERELRARQILEQFRLKAGRRPFKHIQGNAPKLTIAAACSLPRILFLDEPTTNRWRALARFESDREIEGARPFSHHHHVGSRTHL